MKQNKSSMPIIGNFYVSTGNKLGPFKSILFSPIIFVVKEVKNQMCQGMRIHSIMFILFIGKDEEEASWNLRRVEKWMPRGSFSTGLF